MEKIGENRWKATQPLTIQIGKPANPPSIEALGALRNAIATTGVIKVYWFWVSISGDRPHLGLAVAPNDDEIISRMGKVVEPIWKQYYPSIPQFDILRLGNPELDKTILDQGVLLFSIEEGSIQSESIEELITKTYKEPANKPTLIKALFLTKVIIIAHWEDPKSKAMNIQNLIKNGKSFIPFFSDGEHFREGTDGSGLEKMGVNIDMNFFASILKGNELLNLNPGSEAPIEFLASELIPYIDRSRLPKI
jgi:hypothetical protein